MYLILRSYAEQNEYIVSSSLKPLPLVYSGSSLWLYCQKIADLDYLVQLLFNLSR